MVRRQTLRGIGRRPLIINDLSQPLARRQGSRRDPHEFKAGIGQRLGLARISGPTIRPLVAAIVEFYDRHDAEISAAQHEIGN